VDLKVLTSLYVFRFADIESDVDAYQSLVRLGVNLVSQLELGYSIVAMAAALTRPPGVMKALRAEGFVIVAALPRAVNLAKVGLTTSYIMTKDLGVEDRKVCAHGRSLSGARGG